MKSNVKVVMRWTVGVVLGYIVASFLYYLYKGCLFDMGVAIKGGLGLWLIGCCFCLYLQKQG